MKKIIKRILIILAILIFLGSFISSMNTKNDDTWYLEQYIKRN